MRIVSKKRFRIQNYQAYSHPQKWANDLKLMPTNFGQYSQLTNPTGITIPEKEMGLGFCRIRRAGQL